MHKYKCFVTVIIFFLVIFTPHQKLWCGVSSFTPSFVKFEIISQGYYSGYNERKFLLIKTQEQWREVWDIHAGIKLPPSLPPKIDFNRQMIIAVFAGEYPSGGFEIRIANIEKTENKVLVNIIETKLKRDHLTTQTLSQPYQIVQIEATDLPIEFIEK